MSKLKFHKASDLADTNLFKLILSAPDCRKSAICFFISGDAGVIPSEFLVESPSKKVSLRYFADGSILLVSDDTAHPYYSFEDFSADRYRGLRRLFLRPYFKDFIKRIINFSK